MRCDMNGYKIEEYRAEFNNILTESVIYETVDKGLGKMRELKVKMGRNCFIDMAAKESDKLTGKRLDRFIEMGRVSRERKLKGE